MQAWRSDGVVAFISDAVATRAVKHGRHWDAPAAAVVIGVPNIKNLTSSFSSSRPSFKLEFYFSRANRIVFAARLHYTYKQQEENGQ